MKAPNQALENYFRLAPEKSQCDRCVLKMKRETTFWRTFWRTYLAVQTVGIALGIVCLLPVPAGLHLSGRDVLFYSIRLGVPVTFLPTLLYSAIVTQLARRLIGHSKTWLLHLCGVTLTASIFCICVLVISHGQIGSRDQFTELVPYFLACIGASLAGTGIANASVRAQTREIHNKAIQVIAAERGKT